MKVHHLSAATFCPYGSGLIYENDLFRSIEVVAHCLLIESDEGLILVDTGFGTADVESARERFGAAFMNIVRPVMNYYDTIHYQIRKLGFSPRDIRHIIPTHLDLDHCGALPDFAEASVHVYKPEYEAAMNPQSAIEKERYVAGHFAHHPRWQLYSDAGESWNGFSAVRQLEGVHEDIALIPLPGHTRGHCAVAVNSDHGWLMHCGDAYFHRGELVNDSPFFRPALEIFQSTIACNNGQRKENQRRLRRLYAEKGSEIDLFCAHDHHEFSCMCAGRPVER